MFSGVKHSNTPRFHPASAFCAACVRCNGRSRPACFAGGSRVVLPALHAGRLHQMRPSLGGELRFLPYPSHFDDGSVHPPRAFVNQKVRTVFARLQYIHQNSGGRFFVGLSSSPSLPRRFEKNFLRFARLSASSLSCSAFQRASASSSSMCSRAASCKSSGLLS